MTKTAKTVTAASLNLNALNLDSDGEFIEKDRARSWRESLSLFSPKIQSKSLQISTWLDGVIYTFAEGPSGKNRGKVLISEFDLKQALDKARTQPDGMCVATINSPWTFGRVIDWRHEIKMTFEGQKLAGCEIVRHVKESNQFPVQQSNLKQTNSRTVFSANNLSYSPSVEQCIKEQDEYRREADFNGFR